MIGICSKLRATLAISLLGPGMVWLHRKMMRRGKRRGCQHRAFVMLRVDALELHISGETGLELAHHRRQARHFGNRIEQRS